MTPVFLNVSPTAGGISIEWESQGPLLESMARQLPFAASLALNRTALEAVAEVRREAAKKFTRRQRSQEYFNQSFQVTQFSKKNSLEIEFGISRGLMQGRGASLMHHEDGATRTAKSRNDFPYIPVIGSSVRLTRNDLVPRFLYPKALGLIDSRYTANGLERGQDRTLGRRGSKIGIRARENRKAFILRDKQGDPVGIFRRMKFAGPLRSTSARRNSILELLFFTPKVIRVEPRLGFRKLAEHALVTRIQANFQGMLDYAMDEGRQERNALWKQIDAAQLAPFTARR